MLNDENPLYRDFPHAPFETEGGVAKIQKPAGTTYFTYNDANLVESIHYSDDTWSYFHYDGKLRRYAIQDDEFGLSYFTWDQNGVNLLAERNEAGEVTAKYTHGYTPVEGIGSMVEAERIEDGCSYYQYPVYDHRGTVHKLIDESGTEVASYTYNAFGEILDQTNPPEGNRFKYQTNWMALKEDLYLSPSRMYSGELGRFLQKDPLPKLSERGKLGVLENSIFAKELDIWLNNNPLGKLIGENAYVFVKNDAINETDFLGYYEQNDIYNAAILTPFANFRIVRYPKNIRGCPWDWVRTDGYSGWTKSEPEQIVARCQCLARMMDCEVRYKERIYISDRYKDPNYKRYDIDKTRITRWNIYGHEQRHILGTSNRIYRSVQMRVPAQMNRIYWDICECEEAAKELEKYVNELIDAQLKREELHMQDGFGTPEDYKVYPPMVGGVMPPRPGINY